MKEQELLLGRLPHFKARTSECLNCRLWTISREDFLYAEQIHTHHAMGQCKAEYVDIVEFWLYSLFNFLEDLFEDNQFKEQAAQSEWKPLKAEEIIDGTSKLFQQIGNDPEFQIYGKVKKSFQMFSKKEVIAFLVETETEYTSFFWRADVTHKAL